MVSVVQIVSLLAVTLGLSKLLFDPSWGKSDEVGRSFLRFLGIIVSVGLAIWCSSVDLITSTGELFAAAVAVVPLSLLAFWSVTFRDSIALRMATFIGLLIVLALLLTKPIVLLEFTTANDTGLFSLQSHDRLRLVVGIFAGMIAGVYSRVLGWRIQIRDAENAKPDASTLDLWVLILGIVISVPLLLFLQSLVQSRFSNLFDPNFEMIRMACFYAACMLAFLSIMVCRFTNQWLVAASVIIAGLLIQFWFGEELYHKLGFMEVQTAPSWYHLTPLFILVWWLSCLLLRQLDVAFQRTGELLLFQFQLKHFVVGTGIACFIVAGVKSQYVDQFGKTLQRQMQLVGGDVGFKGNEIVALKISNDGVPDLLLKALPRLQQLESVQIVSSSLEQDLVSLLAKCPNLKSLELHTCPRPIGGPADFSGFKRLERLVLFEPGFTGSEFSQLTSESPIKVLVTNDLFCLQASPIETLEKLDLTSAHLPFSLTQPGWEIDDLLKIKADQLETVVMSEYQHFTEVPLNLPRLRELQLRCQDLTPQIVDDLNQLKNLNHLALWDCKSGFERIKELPLDRVEVCGDCDRRSLEYAAREPKVQRVQGKAKLADIEAVASLLIAANNERGLSLDLAAEETAKEAVERFLYGSSGFQVQGAAPGIPRNVLAHLTQQQARVLQIDPGKQNIFARQMRLELDDLVELCRNATNVNVKVDASVYDDDHLVLKRYRTFINGPTNAGLPLYEDFTTSKSSGELFDLTDSSWKKLEPLIDAGVALHLVRPALSSEGWRRLANRHEKLTVVWKELPNDFELVLDELAKHEVRFYVEASLTEHERQAFDKRAISVQSTSDRRDVWQ